MAFARLTALAERMSLFLLKIVELWRRELVDRMVKYLSRALCHKSKTESGGTLTCAHGVHVHIIIDTIKCYYGDIDLDNKPDWMCCCHKSDPLEQ